MTWGELQLKSWQDFPELHERWSRHESDLPYPGGECGAEVFDRCKPILDRIIRGQVERAALVIHGGTIRCILSGLLRIPFERRFYLGAPLENCSITVVKYREEDGRFYLNSFNDSAHLRG